MNACVDRPCMRSLGKTYAISTIENILSSNFEKVVVILYVRKRVDY